MTDSKYILVRWPDIQDFMNHPEYPNSCYYDPQKEVWFVPERWESDNLGLGGDIGDLEDALG